MNLSISNIGWPARMDLQVYGLMKEYGYSGLEIAPTRIFPEEPYERIEEAGAWGRQLKEDYQLTIPSMQSIWYGRTENVFGTKKEREILLEYTKKAIDFAAVIGCKNLVFGCPKNRNLPKGADPEPAVGFFKELGDYAAVKKTVIGLEANPPIYHTNFVNDTESALKLIERVDSSGFLLNLDVGTIIQNGERISELEGKVRYINHVHISEPGLELIVQRKLHEELFQILKEEGYRGFVSIEMGKRESSTEIETVLGYVKQIFGKECVNV
ncbi:MAG: sugar phosphate isomerase/epimerase [Lachnospiraceae bacterium]|nr:sugar phosphate isomerase/epimerase [Lachnospiraceae bacterium]